jgi:hypothetical protein
VGTFYPDGRALRWNDPVNPGCYLTCETPRCAVLMGHYETCDPGKMEFVRTEACTVDVLTYGYRCPAHARTTYRPATEQIALF